MTKQPHWREVAMTATFMFAGYIAAMNKEKDAQAKHGGQVEIANQLADCAQAIEAYLQQHRDHEVDFPGVYVYEVAEPIGALLRAQPDLTPSTALKIHHDFMVQWFAADGQVWPSELKLDGQADQVTEPRVLVVVERGQASVYADPGVDVHLIDKDEEIKAAIPAKFADLTESQVPA
jgi:hypothetical protein